MSGPEPVRLAVVGSTTMPYGEARAAVLLLIEAAFGRLRECIEAAGGFVVSGGADGVDSWGREVAYRFGWHVWNGKFVEHLPANRRWTPDGYQARNLLIAQDCTHLLRIYRPDSTTYGSGWTADQAERLGKVVNRYVWAPDEGRFRRVERAARAAS